MPAAETPVAYLGIDVGKSSHSACALDAGGGVAFRAELANRPDDIDRLLERAGSGALVVVDQKRNIGALVLARAHAHGNPCAYLPGYAEKQARGMFPGIAKTDAIDAEVIARTALTSCRRSASSRRPPGPARRTGCARPCSRPTPRSRARSTRRAAGRCRCWPSSAGPPGARPPAGAGSRTPPGARAPPRRGPGGSGRRCWPRRAREGGSRPARTSRSGYSPGR